MRRIKEFLKYALAVICLLASFTSAEELSLNINVKKPIAVVNEKFLSITLDPIALFNTDFLSDVEKSTNMARALAPAYVRIGGPRSNSYVFERGLYPQETHPDPGLTFTETQWINLHQWAERSGLDVVACIAPQMSDGTRAWDPRNALDLISFSDHMGYNTSWQLGYECQTNCKVSGGDLGRDVARLRSMLDAFPRFAETGLVVGPDVVSWRSKQEQQYLQDYFNAAAAGLSALTWHPDFAGVTLEEDGVSMHYDNLAIEKDALYKVVGRQIAKKPLWIAESKPEDCKRQFLGALVWARRLGNSAKLGAQVILRQPENSNLLRPTPDFWVSMLHKMLVGREVLDTKIASGNRTHVHFYTQCTRPSSKYEKGSITIFGINLTPSKIAATLKGLKVKAVHKYVLLPGYDSPNRMFAETVLLNNDLLSLINGKEMPEINPIIYNVDRDIKLKLPSGGIGFWVLPGLKVKSCMGPDDDTADKNVLRKANRRLEDMEDEEDLEPADDNSREIYSFDSVEDRKSLLKHQLHRRLTARRSIRHRDIDRDDERSPRRNEWMKRDVHKHEKIAKKREHSDYTESDEKDEEAIERKISDGQPLDSGEEIRAKLYEYKRRLADHEHRKKQREKAIAFVKKSGHDEPEKNMDTGKVIEALTLITKVENAMKDLDKNDTQRLSLSPMLGANDDSSGITLEMKKSTKSDGLLDEVLNTEKAKRTAVPTNFEDQLKALYRILSEEKDKKDSSRPLRHRRDLDKRVGDDPLGIRRDSIFLRKRSEAKERRNERRQRIRERIEEHRRERESTTKKVARDTSHENNFYGFQYRTPLTNFPEGDLYVQGGTTSETNPESTATKPTMDEHPDVWLEEGDGNHMPNEFYENVKVQGLNTKPNMKEYSELWEAEAVHKGEDDDKNINGAAEYAAIVTEKPLTPAEDRKAKEQAVQQLINYYETAPQSQSYYYDAQQQQQSPQLQQSSPQMQPQQQIYYQPLAPANYQQTAAAGKYYAASQGKFSDVNRYYLDPNQYPQQSRRAKRDISDLENLLHQEMIDEDDDNLKDCQCRVIRGTENCKDCQLEKTRLLAPPLALPGQVVQNPVVRNYGQKLRVRRDTGEVAHGEVAHADDVEDGAINAPEIIPEGAPGLPDTVVPEHPDVHHEIAAEEEIDEATVNGEDAASIEHEAVNVEVTMDASKEDGSDADGPLHLQMNLEAEEDEPLGSRVARKTETTKFFRKKSKVTTTTATPEKKIETSQPETTTTTASNVTKVEPSTVKSKADDRRAKVSRSIAERNSKAAAAAASKTINANQPTNTASANVANQPTITEAANESSATFTATGSQPSAETAYQPAAIAFANQASIATVTGTANHPSVTFTTTANQPINTAFANTGGQQPFITTFTNPAGQTFIGITNQPIDPAFIGANTQSTVGSTAENKAKTFDSITIRADRPSTKITGTTIDNTKSAVPVPNGEDKSNAETSASVAKKQNTSNAEAADSKKSPSNQATNSTILSKTATPKSVVGSKTGTSPPAKRSPAASKASNTGKFDDLVKARHARLTTRSEALAALRKENENRRAKKMIEASLKLLESESARFAEYEKRRRDQLDRLKDKLRAKREKMLHQYKEELIEAIHDGEQKQSNLRRRDLFDGYPRMDEEPGFVNYSPYDMRSLHENLESPLAGSEGQYYMSDDSDEDEEGKHFKRSMSLDQPLADDEEMYDASSSEFRSANYKRSPPMVVVDLKKNKPQIMEGDSGEYYTPEQQKLLEKRVTEAQKRLQQQRQQQQQQMEKRREELLRQQRELQAREEQAKLQKQAAAQGQYPHVQQPYPPQVQQPYPPQAQQPYPPHMQQPYPPHMQQPYPSHMQQPYSPHMQQPYPPHAQQPYSPHVQQPYPPTVQPQVPGQQRQSPQQYAQAQHSGKNATPVNVQYSQPPQASPQQQPAYPRPPVPAEQQVAPQSQSAIAQRQQQQYVQQPNAAYYNQQPPTQPQQPAVNYYNQNPAAQQAAAAYYNYAQAEVQEEEEEENEEADVEYTTQQDSAAEQQKQQPQPQQQAAEYYSQQTAIGQQQYYYPPATPTQQSHEEYYKQLAAASQQPTDAKTAQNPQQATAGVSSSPQPAAPQPQVIYVPQQRASSPQAAAPQQQVVYQQQQAAADQSKQAETAQQIPDVQLYVEQSENTENLQDLKVYQPATSTAEESTPYDANSYYQIYQDSKKKEPEVNPYEISPTAYESVQQAPASRGYKKSKRSNLKVLEINPSIYDDDDSDYNLHELFMRPSSRFSSRSYRSYPHDTDYRRYRRDVQIDDKEDGPLSISLGLDLPNMLSRKNSPAVSEFTRRKRHAEDEADHGKSTINKNIKKVYNYDENPKKTPKKLTLLKRADDSKEAVQTIPTVRKLRLVDIPLPINFFSPVKVMDNNDLDENKNKDTILTRRRRSPDAKFDHHVKYNHIDRDGDFDMNEIWHDIIEMKHDDALDEYDRRKNELFNDFIKDQKPDSLSTTDDKESMIQKVGESTTKANIESIIVEAIPKLENVITGGIEKAQNLTGNFEDFIENFDEQFDETTENVQEILESPEDMNNGRLSHSVFKTVMGGVKKFFGFITGFAKIFHKKQ